MKPTAHSDFGTRQLENNPNICHFHRTVRITIVLAKKTLFFIWLSIKVFFQGPSPGYLQQVTRRPFGSFVICLLTLKQQRIGFVYKMYTMFLSQVVLYWVIMELGPKQRMNYQEGWIDAKACCSFLE